MNKNKLSQFQGLTKTAIAVITACSLSAAASAGELKEVEQIKRGDSAADQHFNAWLQAQRQQAAEIESDQYIIEFDSTKEAKKETKRLAKELKKAMRYERKLAKGKHVLKLEEKLSKDEKKALLNSLRADKNVKFVEEDPVRFLMAQSTPWGYTAVQAAQLSDSAAGALTVCIIDSGYDASNPDLSANNATGTNDSGTGNWYQAGGSHGSHVAGTIAAVNNSIGVKGVLPNTQVNLHIVKVFNESGWGYSSDLVTAVNTCVNNGADVVNMSLGGPSSSTSEKNGLEAATAAGVLLIAASGNDGDASLSYPASYDTVMAVAAVDENGQHAEFSQYTPQVEISGPGEAILSTVAGDGRLGSLTVGTTSYTEQGVVPQSRYVQSGSSYVVSDINGTVSGTLASCSRSGSTYSCGSMTGKICVAERNANQGTSYPEVNAAKACADAGAAGVVVYSNTERPGLQNPFLVDATGAVDVPTVSVNRTVGQALLAKAGQSATLSVTGNQDYAYYNGTSMATPHVTAVAALAWSNNLDCTAAQVRTALKATAMDLDVAGRDDRTGYGLVQAKAASDYMALNCGSGGGSGGGSDNSLENGVAKTGLSGSQNEQLLFTLDVPAGATGLSFNMSGGSGDADLYVKFGSEPTTSSYDCRPYKSGNSESCPISTAQAGTYYVKLIGYSAFSGVSLVGSFTEGSTGGGGGATGYTTTINDIAASKGTWKYYTLDVPAGMSTFSVNTANGSGDADLYVRFGAQPTTSSYDCRPYKSGNTESCSFTNPTAGTWHIGVRAYSTFSGLDMTVSYQP
ncbi:S8 family serine peptidase [Bowmanella sp. JS7-9]|uniref:S8 family serine peptidase n=1 Tax=Pseudobowmanella zhangzhouensis TaxID=1537679 RepID=A0ABW1XQL3_9ALTE|nr:S8 family serine peptidase [Bowmanella sp. JS7-9]TBX21978.1 peptidase S8 [Bowmanella sp. JS7-9]